MTTKTKTKTKNEYNDNTRWIHLSFTYLNSNTYLLLFALPLLLFVKLVKFIKRRYIDSIHF